MVLDSPYPSRISNDLVGISQCGGYSGWKTLKRFRLERIMKVYVL